MKRKAILIVVILGLLVSTAGATQEAFKGIQEIKILVENIRPGFGFTDEDVEKYVYVRLKAKIPSLKIVDTSAPLLYIEIHLQKQGAIIGSFGFVRISLNRTVFLPDKKTSLIAEVWDDGTGFSHPGEYPFAYIKEILDDLLDKFAYDYLKLPKVLIPEPAPATAPDTKSPDSRLQDNGWIRIIDQYVTKEAVEEFNKRHGFNTLESEKGKIERTLHIKIMFLKPCKTSWKVFEDIFSETVPVPSGDPSDMLPSIRCNYRNKVFVTYYIKGIEARTDGSFPMPPSDMNTLRLWKEEVLPGDTASVSFTIPDYADSWLVWVPK